jgi:hypothetical protein
MRHIDEDMAESVNTNALKNLFYNEAVLKRLARAYGPGVEFTRGKEVRKGGARGAIAVYGFKDINDVRIDTAKLWMMQSLSMSTVFMDEVDLSEMDEMEEMFAMGGMDGLGGGAKAVGFELEKAPGGSRLTVLVPQPAESAPVLRDAASIRKDEQAEDPYDESDFVEISGMDRGETMRAMLAMGPQAYAGMSMAMGGMSAMAEDPSQFMKSVRFRLLVEPKGEIKEADASHRDAKTGRYTILDADFARMSTSPDFARLVDAEEMFDMGEMPSFFTMFKSAPGLIREPKPEVAFQFK